MLTTLITNGEIGGKEQPPEGYPRIQSAFLINRRNYHGNAILALPTPALVILPFIVGTK